MSRGEPPRTLVLGPLGLQPWVTRRELISQLQELGDVVFDNDVDAIVPTLEPVPPRLGRVAASLPVLGLWSGRMYWRWRRSARRGLREREISRVVVWDPLWAALVRNARPRGVEIIWAWDGSPGERMHQRLLQRWLRYSCDRWVAAGSFESAQWCERVFT